MQNSAFGWESTALLMPLGEPLEVPVPANLAEQLGYTWMPLERYLCFFRREAVRSVKTNFIWCDGTLWGHANESAWNQYINHECVAPSLSAYQLGGTRSDGNIRPSKHCLVLDTTENRVHAAPLDAALALARRASSEALRSLPKTQQTAYRRAVTCLLGQDVDSAQVQLRRTTGVAGLKHWLDQQAAPF